MGITCLLRHVEEVVNQCDVCKAFDKAPHTPIAGTSAVAMFNEKLQVDLLFLDDLIALHIMAVFPKYSILTLVRSKNPLEVWDAFVACWIGIFGPPKAIQMDEGGEWKNEVWADFCADRRIKLFFQGVGVHPWILERRNGLARGIYKRMMADGRFSGRRVLTEVQWCLNTLIPASEYSAFQLVFGSNPAMICFLPRIPRRRGSSPNIGNSV